MHASSLLTDARIQLYFVRTVTLSSPELAVGVGTPSGLSGQEDIVRGRPPSGCPQRFRKSLECEGPAIDTRCERRRLNPSGD